MRTPRSLKSSLGLLRFTQLNLSILFILASSLTSPLLASAQAETAQAETAQAQAETAQAETAQAQAAPSSQATTTSVSACAYQAQPSKAASAEECYLPPVRKTNLVKLYQQQSPLNQREAIVAELSCRAEASSEPASDHDKRKTCASLKGAHLMLQQTSWSSINNQEVYLKAIDDKDPTRFALYKAYNAQEKSFSDPLQVNVNEAKTSEGQLSVENRLPKLIGLFAPGAECFADAETLHIALTCSTYTPDEWARIPNANTCEELAKRPLIISATREKWTSLNGVKVSLDYIGDDIFRAWRLDANGARSPLTPKAEELKNIGHILPRGSLKLTQHNVGRFKSVKGLKELAEKFSPILILLMVIGLVIARLPKIDLGHSPQFKRRRVMNWLPMGLTYAFLYMGRYNLTVASSFLIAAEVIRVSDFGIIFAAGTVSYGFAFVINGPLTDRFGGKFAILVGSGGSALCNFLMGYLTLVGSDNLVRDLSILYAFNMYFQSFGAVAIVKVNAPWFHVNERGVFGAIFGILISLGVYFAFDWGSLIVNNYSISMVFFTPTVILAVLWVVDLFVVKNTPSDAGFEDFDTADASSGDDGPRLGALEVFKMMLKNRVIMIIACVEFCSGFLRQAIMQYYRIFAQAVGATDSFVYHNWGLLLCCAGILGGVFAGVISDRIFNSRRGPVASVLYSFMLLGSILMCYSLHSAALGAIVIFLSLSVIGVHGMLSGTASMDFGGKRNVGVAVGIIDGFVYLGTGFMALLYSQLLPSSSCERIVVDNWIAWPIAMIPVSLIGLALAYLIWDAKPRAKQRS